MKQLIFIFSIFYSSLFFGQTSLNSSSYDIMNYSGSFSYSIGQLLDENLLSSAGSISQGIQYPYEISVLDVKNMSDDFSLSIYPNPSSNSVKLKIADLTNRELSGSLLDQNGKILENFKIEKVEHTIKLLEYPNAVYVLKIFSNNENIKTFRIIKNN
jgi:hypothetical protein